jgi:hypothetical protein
MLKSGRGRGYMQSESGEGEENIAYRRQPKISKISAC